ncbi:hypothetical protein [Azospirillum argentinense]
MQIGKNSCIYALPFFWKGRKPVVSSEQGKGPSYENIHSDG